MARIPLRADLWEYDDVANTITGIFTDMARADDQDPVRFRPSVRLIAVIPLAATAIQTPPIIQRRRI